MRSTAPVTAEQDDDAAPVTAIAVTGRLVQEQRLGAPERALGDAEAAPPSCFVDPGRVRRGVHVVRGDPTDPATVRSAKPEGAQQALVAGAGDGDVLVSTVILRKQARAC